MHKELLTLAKLTAPLRKYVMNGTQLVTFEKQNVIFELSQINVWSKLETFSVSKGGLLLHLSQISKVKSLPSKGRWEQFEKIMGTNLKIWLDVSISRN